MARADDELPEIEVVDGYDADVSDGNDDAGGSSSTTWFVGLAVAAAVMAVLGLTFATDRPPAEDGTPSTTALQGGPDGPSNGVVDAVGWPLPLSGQWRSFSSSLTGTLDRSPFMAGVDDDRVVILYTENGGEDVVGEILDLRSGDADPIADSPLNWRTSPMIGWTGREVIVVGGDNGPGIEIAGAAYNPETDSWRQIADPPGFVPGRSDTQVVGPGVWTGDELISWQSRVAYDPASDTWREIAQSPLTPRVQAAVAATASSRVLVWGGCDPTSIDPARCHDDGALFDPLTDEWTLVPAGPLDGGFGSAAVATTWESRIVVVVPSPADPTAATVAALDPSTLEWHELAGLPDELKMRSQRVVWTGTHLVSWSESLPGVGETGFVLSPAFYESSPRLGQWRPISDRGVDVQVHTSAWTRHGLVLAGGTSRELFTRTVEPCPGQYDASDLSDPGLDDLERLPKLGATTYDAVAATIVEDAHLIAERYDGTVDLTVGPGWGVAYDDNDGQVKIHRGLDDHTITVHLADSTFCGYVAPAFFSDRAGRSIPVRFVYEKP